MNYSELLHDFLDGTLGSEHQEALFIALAQETELRSEMQQLLRIKRAVQNDTEAFMPPPEAREAIFARLGFGTAIPAPPVPVQTPVAANTIAEAAMSAAPKAGRFLWREVLLSSLATSLFTGLLFFFFLRPYGNSMSTGFFGGNSGNGGNGAMPPTSGYAQTNAMESPSGRHTLSSSTQDTMRVLREVVHHYHDASQDANVGTLQREFTNFQTMMLALTGELRSALHDAQAENKRLTAERTAAHDMQALPLEHPTEHLPQEPQKSQTEQPVAASHDTAPKTGEWYNNLTLGVRGMRSRSLPQATIGSNAAQAIAPNTAISALYRLAAQHEIGIEAGQEAFFQSFRSRNNEGIPFIIEQNPTLSWAGVAYRYTLFPESMLTPFVHTVLGGADVGLTGRAMLGVRFAPDSRTQFLLGAEASAIIYGHQGLWYTSENIGFTYGVSIRF
jgi:hypothetical protein